MKRTLILCILFALFSLLIISCASSTAPHFKNPNKTYTKQSDGSTVVVVDGRYYLTDTGIDVKKGDTIKFKATGEVNWNNSDPTTMKAGPNGAESGGWGLWYTITDNIGYRPFFVGAEPRIKPSAMVASLWLYRNIPSRNGSRVILTTHTMPITVVLLKQQYG